MVSFQLLPKRLRRRPQLAAGAAEVTPGSSTLHSWLKRMPCSSPLSFDSAIETGAVHGAGLPHLATFSAPDSALHRWPKTLSLRNVTAEVINAFFWDAAVAGAQRKSGGGISYTCTACTRTCDTQA